jgi:hypothetical protein
MPAFHKYSTSINQFWKLISACDRPPNPATDKHFSVLHSMTTLAAFDCIIDLLQLDCAQDTGFNICATTLPSAMAPTLHQQLIPLKPYIDMLPWVSLRDQILRSLLAIDEIGFVNDMAEFKVWGTKQWDPPGWE